MAGLLVRRRGNRGAGKVGCLLMLLVLGGAGYSAFQLGVPYYHNASFSERVKELMPYLRGHYPKDIRQSVIKVAKDFDLDLKPEQVQVEIIRNRMLIDVRYERTVVLPYWSRTITFRPHFEAMHR